jgi:hypothetical protein
MTAARSRSELKAISDDQEAAKKRRAADQTGDTGPLVLCEIPAAPGIGAPSAGFFQNPTVMPA